ncbi:MAG: hypothetical protein JRI71_04000 [Deltaproteobacteria bacterium]|nr:hypothetical protein [Deltaproteobacteria bacterium]
MVKTFAGLAVGIIAISFASIFIKFCEDVPSLMIATYRLVISSAIFLCIHGAARYRAPAHRPHLNKLGIETP